MHALARKQTSHPVDHLDSGMEPSTQQTGGRGPDGVGVDTFPPGPLATRKLLAQYGARPGASEGAESEKKGPPESLTVITGNRSKGDVLLTLAGGSTAGVLEGMWIVGGEGAGAFRGEVSEVYPRRCRARILDRASDLAAITGAGSVRLSKKKPDLPDLPPEQEEEEDGGAKGRRGLSDLTVWSEITRRQGGKFGADFIWTGPDGDSEAKVLLGWLPSRAEQSHRTWRASLKVQVAADLQKMAGVRLSKKEIRTIINKLVVATRERHAASREGR